MELSDTGTGALSYAALRWRGPPALINLSREEAEERFGLRLG
jgi:hypothetical protein